MVKLAVEIVSILCILRDRVTLCAREALIHPYVELIDLIKVKRTLTLLTMGANAPLTYTLPDRLTSCCRVRLMCSGFWGLYMSSQCVPNVMGDMREDTRCSMSDDRAPSAIAFTLGMTKGVVSGERKRSFSVNVPLCIREVEGEAEVLEPVS
jgi:hypothetical protein